MTTESKASKLRGKLGLLALLFALLWFQSFVNGCSHAMMGVDVWKTHDR